MQHASGVTAQIRSRSPVGCSRRAVAVDAVAGGLLWRGKFRLQKKTAKSKKAPQKPAHAPFLQVRAVSAHFGYGVEQGKRSANFPHGTRFYVVATGAGRVLGKLPSPRTSNALFDDLTNDPVRAASGRTLQRRCGVEERLQQPTRAMALLFAARPDASSGGRAIGLLGKEISIFAKSGGVHTEEKGALLSALGDLNGIIAVLVGHAMASQEKSDEIYKVGLNTSRCLMAVGDVITAWLLLRQADIAVAKLPTAGRETDFYAGKIASAKFFVRNYLPHITADRIIVEATDNSIMEIAEGAF